MQDDYKTILRNRVDQLKSHNKQITFQNLAKHCRVQNTYLSRVLGSTKNHFSPDQLYLAIEFLGFNSEEQNYISLLYERTRTELTARRDRFTLKIERYRNAQLRTEAHIDVPKPEISQQDWTDYYLDPYSQLTHLFLTIPEYASKSETLRKKLGLSHLRFDRILKSLLRLGVVNITPNGYEVIIQQMHLPSDSSLLSPYRTLLRLKGLDRIQSLSNEKAYTFSVLFTASPEERKWIQSEFLSFLKRVEKIVKKAQPREVYQMSFDLFDWSS